MFVLRKGKTKFLFLPMTASTAITAGSLVTYTSGQIVAATSSTAVADILGVLRHTIASTDTDYATAGRLVEVEMPVERFTEWEADVTSGLVLADIEKEVDLTDANNVNRAANSIKAVRATKVLTTTKGWFHIKFSGSY